MVLPANFSRSNAGWSMENFLGEPSDFSLTFGVSQNATGGLGKVLGSMNVDELLKNAGTAEELEAMASAMQSCQGGATCGNVRQQCSFVHSRMLSQKVVEEVLKDGGEESSGKDGDTNAGPKLEQRQQALGEMTLKEFLLTDGMVNEDTQLAGRQSSFEELSSLNNDAALSFGFPVHSNGIAGVHIMENHSISNNNGSVNQPVNISTNLISCRLQNEILSDQMTVPYGCLGHGEYTGCPIMRSGIIKIGDPTIIRDGGKAQQGEPATELITLKAGAVTLPARCSLNQLCLDGMNKGVGYTLSIASRSSASYDAFNGKEHNPNVENARERRQRRMLKNRESAARSRARKQAYTTELEVELAQLREENEALKKKQAQIIEMNQVLETTIKEHHGFKKQCLRRTLTGPW